MASFLRVISGYRTILEALAPVIAAVPLIELLLNEKYHIYVQNRDVLDQSVRQGSKNAEQWYNRQHGQVNYYLTHALLRHGCLNTFLNSSKTARQYMPTLWTKA